MATHEEIESFHQFALQQLNGDCAELSVADLAGLWQTRNLPESELTESVAAIKASLQDLHNGDLGRPAEEVIAELRARYPTSESE